MFFLRARDPRQRLDVVPPDRALRPEQRVLGGIRQLRSIGNETRRREVAAVQHVRRTGSGYPHLVQHRRADIAPILVGQRTLQRAQQPGIRRGALTRRAVIAAKDCSREPLRSGSSWAIRLCPAR